MDNSEAVTQHIGLCAGYGGIELGLKRVIRNLRTVALCEVEAFAVANLVAKMEAGYLDPAPVWTDLKTFPYGAFHGKVDILTGGYPCQPFSAAGRRAGKDDPRHLWPWIADGIRILRPKLCFFENVEGHISLGLSDVIEDLAGMGYRTTWGIFSASEVGAPHQRKRVFILAHRDSERGQLQDWWRLAAEQMPECVGEARRDGQLADAKCGGLSSGRNDPGQPKISELEHCGAWPSRPGEQQHGWEPPRTTAQSALGGDFDGIACRMDYAQLLVSQESRTDELRLLGNGVVPSTAALAFRTLMQELRNPPANFSLGPK